MGESLLVDLSLVRVGDRVLDREVNWHDVIYVRLSATGQHKIAHADAPYWIRWFYHHGIWQPEFEAPWDIMAVRFVAKDRDEPLPVDPPGDREIAFPSGQGRWLLEKIRQGVN
jgi:hypothetical protein